MRPNTRQPRWAVVLAFQAQREKERMQTVPPQFHYNAVRLDDPPPFDALFPQTMVYEPDDKPPVIRHAARQQDYRNQRQWFGWAYIAITVSTCVIVYHAVLWWRGGWR